MATTDRHKLWRIVAANYEQFAEEAPEGFEVRALVYVAGREAPIEVGQVATDRDPEYPWVSFTTVSPMRIADPDGDPEKTYADDQVVYVHESALLRIELGFVRKELGAKPRQPFGFALTPEPPGDDANG